jgi:hypothetical protein
MPARVGRLFPQVTPVDPHGFLVLPPFQAPLVYYLIEEMDFLPGDFDEYLRIAEDYVPIFEHKFKFFLVAGGFETVRNGRIKDCRRVRHLWKVPDADSLQKVMVGLANDQTYGDIDALVGKLGYESQDMCINFGWEHAKVFKPKTKPKAGFRYVVAHHQLWTTDLNTFAWDFDFDAGYDRFLSRNPGWVHLGNRMKLTGAIYDVFELWIAPKHGNPETVLLNAPWIAQTHWDRRKPKISVLKPIEYDHNL